MRVSTAPGRICSRYTGSPVATTARLREVGMPSACIASLMTNSRSIGPTRRASVAAARVRRLAGALQLHVDAAVAGRDLLAQQDRPPVAERREVAELMAGVGLGERPGAVGQGVAGEDRGAVRRIEGLARRARAPSPAPG